MRATEALELSNPANELDQEEFICYECGNVCSCDNLGAATLNGKRHEVCKGCCYNEQQRQFYAGL